MSLILLVAHAHAGVYGGNPDIWIGADRPQHDLIGGDVHLTKIRMHHCDNTFVDTVINEAIDPIEGYTLAFSAGSWCAVSVFWGSDMTLDGEAFALAYGEPVTQILLDAPVLATPLTPIDVLYGSPGYGDPVLKAVIGQQ